MLGGIDNNLFFSSFGGFLVIVLILIPILKWTFPSNQKDRDRKLERRRLKRDLRRLKRK
jgi:hypothetical protein